MDRCFVWLSQWDRFGLITGVAMVREWGFITPENDGRITAIAMVLLISSLFIAQWEIRPRAPQAS